MKIANQITFGRFLLSVGAIVILAIHPLGPPGAWDYTWIAFWLIVVAASTDALDGYVARAMGQTSSFGRLFDPFVDKILVCGSLICLLRLESMRELLPAWIVVVIVARELFVTSLRGMVEAQGKSFGADRLGKWKMVAQCLLVGHLVAYQGGWLWTEPFGQFFLWLSLGLTILSAVNYQRKAWHVLDY